MDAWYYMMHDVKIGPISKADLEKLAAKGIISAKTQVWSPEAAQWRLLEDLNLWNIHPPHPPPPPSMASNQKAEAQSNGCFSLLGKAVAAVFVLGILGAIFGDHPSSNPASVPDSGIAAATHASLAEFKKMDRVFSSGKFSVSNQMEMYNFVDTSISDMLKIQNVDQEWTQYLQRFGQAFAAHKALLQKSGNEMLNAQGNNFQRAEIFSKLEAEMKASDDALQRVIKETDAVVARIKRRYPSTNFNDI